MRDKTTEGKYPHRRRTFSRRGGDLGKESQVLLGNEEIRRGGARVSSFERASKSEIQIRLSTGSQDKTIYSSVNQRTVSLDSPKETTVKGHLHEAIDPARLERGDGGEVHDKNPIGG